MTLEGIAGYTGLLLAPAESFVLQPRPFFALGAKKGLSTLFVLILGHFWCSVVTSVMFSSNHSNIEKKLKNLIKSRKTPKNSKILKN